MKRELFRMDIFCSHHRPQIMNTSTCNGSHSIYGLRSMRLRRRTA
jgi:hypothetical protein